MGIRLPCGVLDFRLSGSGSTEEDVFTNRPAEKDRSLRDDGDVVPQLFLFSLPHIETGDRD